MISGFLIPKLGKSVCSVGSTPSQLTCPCLTGGSIGNLDKHVSDGLEVNAGENLEVLEATSAIEVSENLDDVGTSDAENITEPLAVETATDIEPNLIETNFDNLSGDEKETSNQNGDGFADPDEVVEEVVVEEQEKEVALTNENEIPTESE